ncbi:MAG: FkbM family methyltransferase [Gammaproteobacteria bacterium]|nr:MAG: FkbM family methyltransferase [Gammaproteobacteria bacterium]
MHLFNGFWWPDSDTKLAQVFDWVSDIDEILKHVKKFDVCIQAGGACGQWPAEFAKHFKQVHTFEPVAENYACLKLNVPSNVIAKQASLGAYQCGARIARDEFEDGNAGAWYTVPGGGEVYQTTIDSLMLYLDDACDLIQLDIEGGEFDALQGARHTIEKFHPVVVVEEKPLPHMTVPHTAAGDFLKSLGYREVGRVHRDVIYAHGGE